MFALSLTNMLGAVVLFCAFLQIAQRRFSALLKLSQLAAVALGLMAIGEGYSQHKWPLYAAGGLILIGQVVLWPLIIRRMCRAREEVTQVVPRVGATLVGLLPICVAMTGVLPVTATPFLQQAGLMAMAFAVILLGVWLMIIQNQPLAQISGFLALENGLVMALINTPNLGWAADIGIFALLVIAVSVALIGGWRYQILAAAPVDGAEL